MAGGFAPKLRSWWRYLSWQATQFLASVSLLRVGQVSRLPRGQALSSWNAATSPHRRRALLAFYDSSLHATMDSSADVADSTDWLGTSLACLAPVEQALRCHVCKDFYNSPMITSCNHTFCSLCIRRCLSADGKCPLCRMTDQESKLRGNWALREAIDAFCKARATVLDVARRPPSPPARAASPQPKRKVLEAQTDGGSSSGNGPHTKRTRTSARLSKAKVAEAVVDIPEDEDDVVEILSPRGDGDMDYEPGMQSRPRELPLILECPCSNPLSLSCIRRRSRGMSNMLDANEAVAGGSSHRHVV